MFSYHTSPRLDLTDDLLKLIYCMHTKISWPRMRDYTIGELIVLTDNLKRHIRLRGIGDKSFEALKEHVMSTEEYQFIVQYHEKTRCQEKEREEV